MLAVPQLARPAARGADQDQRQLTRHAGELRDPLARLGVLQAAHPEQVLRRQPVAAPRLGDLPGRTRAHRGDGRLADDPQARALHAQELLHVARDGVRGDDHDVRALHRKVAQPVPHPRPQLLRPPLERRDVVDRHDLRHAGAQRRALHPRRVEDRAATGAAGLHHLVARRGRLAQRGEQAAHVTPDAAGVAGAAGVVGDRQRHGGQASGVFARAHARPGRRRAGERLGRSGRQR
ncbi:MAG: hypothetical protein AVDCRST_MAG79-2227 [uncultured Thermoleophilia bacterium]|uniref:Uncharacterized protein n=1 Tax=uncultured Thermoleophilia bacterium TaxID=1497501 RepID=A0A6J4UB33_9ACTN|nr:MAG: hypothetical protein AVDCRST_MAG79-2227 [uncultured Thermoleophilia bacterium]